MPVSQKKKKCLDIVPLLIEKRAHYFGIGFGPLLGFSLGWGLGKGFVHGEVGHLFVGQVRFCPVFYNGLHVVSVWAYWFFA